MSEVRKQIFSVNPLGKKMENGNALYGIQLRLNGLQRVQQVWKTMPEYCNLQKQLFCVAFDFDCILQKKLSKSCSDEEKLSIITQFVNQSKYRKDITNLICFRQFFSLSEPEQQYLSEWNRVNTHVEDMQVVDIGWDSSTYVLLTLHKTKKKLKKITNFFKQILQKPTQEGCLQITKIIPKMKLLKRIDFEQEPQQLKWSTKSRMLIVGTKIGLYIYAISIENDHLQLDLLQFIKIFTINSFCYAKKSARLFIGTNQNLLMNSITKQFSIQINHSITVSAVQINNQETRLYSSQGQNIVIYDISEDKSIAPLAKVQTSDFFTKLFCHSKLFLFGICKSGYISVFEIKHEGKQRFTSVLTNIDCPPSVSMFGFNERHQIIITTNDKYIVLISTKNVPLFAGGEHNKKIVSGIFDSEANLIVTADELGNILFNNFNIKSTN